VNNKNKNAEYQGIESSFINKLKSPAIAGL